MAVVVCVLGVVVAFGVEDLHLCQRKEWVGGWVV